MKRISRVWLHQHSPCLSAQQTYAMIIIWWIENVLVPHILTQFNWWPIVKICYVCRAVWETFVHADYTHILESRDIKNKPPSSKTTYAYSSNALNALIILQTFQQQGCFFVFFFFAVCGRFHLIRSYRWQRYFVCCVCGNISLCFRMRLYRHNSQLSSIYVCECGLCA